MVFTPGPIFANIVLADEINRTPPKTQSALLEAMQEHRVTVQGKTYKLDEPFFVLATQNPIELEGTYPLPEAQLDRFMFNIIMDYLPEDQEVKVATSTTSVQNHRFQHAVTGADISAFQQLVRRVPIAEPVARYAVSLARTSRPGPKAPDFIKQWVSYGASTRAPQQLILGGKARALMDGRYNVSFEDIRALAKPVLRHRVLLNFHAESERVTTDQIIEKLLAAVPTAEDRGCDELPPSRRRRPRSSIPRFSRGSGISSCSRGPSSRDSSTACTGRRTSARRPTSRSIASYMPGDDIRRIDWRLWARSDRYYLKEFEAETNTNFSVIARRLAVDALRRGCRRAGGSRS